MLSARDIMTKDVVTVSPETEIRVATELLLSKRFNGVPVVKEGKLVGLLCQSDLIVQQKEIPIPSLFTIFDGFIPLNSMKHLEKEIEKIAATTVAQAMSEHPVFVKPETGLSEIAELMVNKKYYTIPVVDDKGYVVGVIGKHDVLQTLLNR